MVTITPAKVTTLDMNTTDAAQERYRSSLHEHRTAISVSTRSCSVGIIRIDMNTINSSDSKKMQNDTHRPVVKTSPKK